jgi:hypothetical protein
MNTAEKSAIDIASDSGKKPVNPHLVELDEPIAMGDGFITEVTVFKPPMKALMANNIDGSALLDNANFSAMAKVIPLATSPVITKLHIENDLLNPADMLRIYGEICTFFMTKAQRDTLPQR